jgi:hypothetical protein
VGDAPGVSHDGDTACFPFPPRGFQVLGGLDRSAAGQRENESEARRATSLLYHAASAVALAWEAARIHEMRGDARRLLLSRLVIDHRLSTGDPFRLASEDQQHAITDLLLGDRAVGMTEAGELAVA